MSSITHIQRQIDFIIETDYRVYDEAHERGVSNGSEAVMRADCTYLVKLVSEIEAMGDIASLMALQRASDAIFDNWVEVGVAEGLVEGEVLQPVRVMLMNLERNAAALKTKKLVQKHADSLLHAAITRAPHGTGRRSEWVNDLSVPDGWDIAKVLDDYRTGNDRSVFEAEDGFSLVNVAEKVRELWLLAHDLLHEVKYPGGQGCEQCLDPQEDALNDKHERVKEANIAAAVDSLKKANRAEGKVK